MSAANWLGKPLSARLKNYANHESELSAQIQKSTTWGFEIEMEFTFGIKSLNYTLLIGNGWEFQNLYSIGGHMTGTCPLRDVYYNSSLP